MTLATNSAAYPAMKIDPLETLRKMVRIGLYADSDLKTWALTLETEIEKIEKLARPSNGSPSSLNQTAQIQFVCLKAEFLDLAGRYDHAEIVLDRHVSTGYRQFRERIKNIQGSPPEPSSKVEDYDRWLRQIVWLHMQYAWVKYFRAGEFKEAILYLNQLEAFIQDELCVRWPSYGTLSRLFYYIGHCQRSLRCFKESVKYFLKSQDAAERRFLQKQENYKNLYPDETEQRRMQRLNIHRRFAVLCTAKGLGSGLAWNAIHQGRLTRAQELCASASTLLLGTGQEPIKAFVKSNRLIALRRASAASTEDAGKAMTGLANLMRKYRSIDDPIGELRCGAEFIRGYTDFLEFWGGTKPDRRKAKLHVSQHITSLLLIASRLKGQSWGVRLRLMQIRFSMAVSDDQIESSTLEEVRAIVLRNSDMSIQAEGLIISAIICARLKKPLEGIEALNRALELVTDDPVIEAECNLILANFQCELGDIAAAKNTVRKWKSVERLVENAYLHRLAEIVELNIDNAIQNFVISFERVDVSWETCEKELRVWLARVARFRAGPNAKEKDIAAILKVAPSTWSRW